MKSIFIRSQYQSNLYSGSLDCKINTTSEPLAYFNFLYNLTKNYISLQNSLLVLHYRFDLINDKRSLQNKTNVQVEKCLISPY